MRRASKLILVLMLALAAFGLIDPAPARAITISPIRTELKADPGVTTPAVFKLFNESDERKTFYITFANFESKDESGDPVFVPGREGIPSWVEAPASVSIDAKQYQEVAYTITPPPDAEPGGYFAGIFSGTTAPPEDGQTNIQLEGRAGTLIFFRVNGDFSEGEKVLEFNTKDKKTFFNRLPVEFFYRFQNSGDDRIKPIGDITIKNIFGHQSKLINANPTGGSALPKSIRRFEAAWAHGGGGIEETPISPEKLKDNASFRETVVWQWQHFALGRYKAELGVTVNNDASRNYNMTAAFWVVPWQLLAVIIGILIVLGAPTLALITLIILIRRRNKTKLPKPPITD